MQVLGERGTRVDVFEGIFMVFLALGTLVGVVVVAYTLYNAYKYRDTDERKDDESLPTLGELPTGGKGGKKLFLSFGISAIIVISLVVWTYGMLLYVEDPDDEFDQDPVEIDVEGDGFAWHFEYANGAEATGTMNVPADQPVAIEVTSGDVWHTFGISDLRVKADAIPGEYDDTWFMAEEAGAQHEIECFELCGDFHTQMTGTVNVMEQDEFETWLDDQLTLDVTIETEDGEAITNVTDEDFQLEIVHQDNDEYDADLEYTRDASDFEDGSVTIDEIEQGGEYDLTITFEDDDFETIEDTVGITDPASETYTVGDADEDTDDDANGTENEADDDETDDEDDDGGEN
ncbi:MULTISPECIES: cytochrome c oxidase subunit II [Natronorubrum]|uniref:Cytochrome c oxidase subunit II n=2 Tax=Natronorubrum bangense TaxID=61858 RepID=A0A4D6HGG4_9EURY|nr:cytochrome c oxidase subunit II [Natronorubrum bangense]ELY43622.1 cytochrome C oxidase subunit II [Natronorubrum bangense JCM 10635]QCC53099.1 cytochrome c oxidase subunit II [Natronorubrum bangense]QCC56208.1 cytochrome c oxidase subunit II [Natronorubrum bangense]